jgi:multidrug efflux system membrane fusion protein
MLSSRKHVLKRNAMEQEKYRDGRGSSDDSGRALGAAFEAHNSDTYGGDVGREFAARNAREAEEIVKPRRTWIWVLMALAIVAIALIVYRLTSGKPAAGAGAAGGKGGQQGPAAITVGQSKTGNMNVYVNALGTVTPVNTVTIYSQITGRVMAVYYREGQLVKKGQPLVEIDPRPYEATLAQAQGTLQRDRGVLAQAKMDLARYQAAFARNAIARQQLEDQEQAVAQDEGTVKTDDATVDYDKVELSYCHIVAPFTGRVGLRLVDPGNTVFSGTGSTLAVITQIQPITVVFNVSEDSLPQVQAQMTGKKTLTVDAFDRSNDNILDTGTLTSLNNEVDTTTGTVKFRATFANKDLKLFPNQFVNARLLVDTLADVTLVPSAAVQHNGTAAFVYLVNANDRVAVQPVTALTSDDRNTAVTGLNAGANLATSGFDRLENGAQVQVGGQPSGEKKAASPKGSPASKP